MSSTCSSSRTSPEFSQPQYFTRSVSNANKWTCTICTTPGKGTSDWRSGTRLMTMHAALQHERHSADHARIVSEREMWLPSSDSAAWERRDETPPLTMEEMKRREQQTHVDHVWDMVPFWMKGIEAAERGEVPSMEEFLESSEADSWQSSGDIWGYAYSPGNWGADEAGWGADAGAWNWGDGDGGGGGGGVSGRCDGSSMRTQKSRSESSFGRKRKVNSFVETIAIGQSADEEKKRLMNEFFELSTEDKIAKIEEIIRFLQKIH